MSYETLQLHFQWDLNSGESTLHITDTVTAQGSVEGEGMSIQSEDDETRFLDNSQ